MNHFFPQPRSYLPSRPNLALWFGSLAAGALPLPV